MTERTTHERAQGKRRGGSPATAFHTLEALVGEMRSVIVEGRAATQTAMQVSRKLTEDRAEIRALLETLCGAGPSTARASRRKLRASPAPSMTLESARQAGQAQLVGWVGDGTLMASEEFAARWGMTSQGLQKAAARGELLPLKVSNRIYYPAMLCELPRPFTSRLCLALRLLSPAQQLIFLLRRHGALDGKSIGELTTSAQQERAVGLAQSWAAEELDAA